VTEGWERGGNGPGHAFAGGVLARHRLQRLQGVVHAGKDGTAVAALEHLRTVSAWVVVTLHLRRRCLLCLLGLLGLLGLQLSQPPLRLLDVGLGRAKVLAAGGLLFFQRFSSDCADCIGRRVSDLCWGQAETGMRTNAHVCCSFEIFSSLHTGARDLDVSPV
jgi:hypothetical protein